MSINDINKEKFEKIQVVGEAGGGLVKVIVNGLGIPTKVEIDSSLFSEKDKAIVCDLLVAAMTDGLLKSDAEAGKVLKDQIMELYQQKKAYIKDASMPGDEFDDWPAPLPKVKWKNKN